MAMDSANTTTSGALEYQDRILEALGPNSFFEPLMMFYLTDNTPVQEVINAAESGDICKFDFLQFTVANAIMTVAMAIITAIITGLISHLPGLLISRHTAASTGGGGTGLSSPS